MRHGILKVLAIAPACVFAAACCKDQVALRLLAGHKTAEDCRLIADQKKDAPISIVCSGEEVTLCWVSNVNQVTFDQGIGPRPGNGIDYYTPTDNVTITVKAGCSSASKSIAVIKQPTPFTFDAAWAQDCQSAFFDIDPNFVSNKVLAIDITAKWSPTYVDPTNNKQVTCTTPPFLACFQQQDNFGFQIPVPMQKTTFGQPVGAIGHWIFDLKAQCPARFRCDPNQPLPFVLTLTCP